MLRGALPLSRSVRVRGSFLFAPGASLDASASSIEERAPADKLDGAFPGITSPYS